MARQAEASLVNHAKLLASVMERLDLPSEGVGSSSTTIGVVPGAPRLTRI